MARVPARVGERETEGQGEAHPHPHLGAFDTAGGKDARVALLVETGDLLVGASVLN